MESHDLSLSALLREKIIKGFHHARLLIPVLYYSTGPHDPEAVLCARELEIFRLYGMNRTAKEIAFRLFISIQSSEKYLTVISRKLCIRRRDLQGAAAEYVRSLRVEGMRES